LKSSGLAAIAIGVIALGAAGCTPKSDTDTTQASPDAASPASASPATTTFGPPTPPPAPDVASDDTKMPDTTTIDGKTVTLKSTPSGLKYYDIKLGSGVNPKVGQTVSVQYTGTLLDGTKFDSSYDHGGTPIDFPIGTGHVIKGWDEGVPTMKVGGKRRLVVPGPLAYGPQPPPGAPIPPDATLIFDIELVAVK
jgi:peptidylprolyl isomerase